VAVAGLGGVGGGVVVGRTSDGGGVCNAVGAGASGGQYRTECVGSVGLVKVVDDLLGLAALVVVVVGRRVGVGVGSTGLRLRLRGLLP
jgi:hypothetical protein